VQACASSYGPVLAADAGTALLLDSGGFVREMQTLNQTRVIDIAASGQDNITAILCEDGRAGIISPDFTGSANEGINLIKADGFTHICGDAVRSDGASFLLWARDSVRNKPALMRLGAGRQSAAISVIDKFAGRLPVIAASLYGGKALFLDTSGVITVYALSLFNQGDALSAAPVVFSYQASGALDAVFINENLILVALSAGAGNPPFILVNILTGETVAIAWPAEVAMKAAASGAGVYGAVLARRDGKTITELVRLDLQDGVVLTAITSVPGEADNFLIAAIPRIDGPSAVITTLNGEDALVFAGAPLTPAGVLQSAQALPAAIAAPAASSGRITAVDNAGSIVFYGPDLQLQATLRLYNTRWEYLSASGTITRGPAGF
jgi:hypothetical protein